jgi:hypothetical protein
MDHCAILLLQVIQQLHQQRNQQLHQQRKPTTKPTTSPTTKPTTSPTTKPTTSPTTKPTTPNCFPDEPWNANLVGDGLCHSITNTEECNWDGGDCCEETCDQSTGNCPTDICLYDCKNPTYNPFAPDCIVNSHFLGDGLCHAESNIDHCGYDAGDCCESTCKGENCGLWGWHCEDPNAVENSVRRRLEEEEGGHSEHDDLHEIRTITGFNLFFLILFFVSGVGFTSYYLYNKMMKRKGNMLTSTESSRVRESPV